MRHFHRVLVVDDDFDERILTERALKKCLGPNGTVQVVSSGNQAIHYMIGDDPYGDRKKHPFPSLVLTDLAMPDGDGFDVLEFLHTNPAWGVVPRIMFSSSNDDDDVRTAFMLGASAFHLKPIGAEKLAAFMHALIAYWTSSEVPPVDADGRLLVTVSTGRRGARFPQPKGAVAMKRPHSRAKT